ERFPSSSLFPLSRACLTLLILILILIPMLIPILKLCLFSVLCPWCPDNRGQIIWYESLEDENVRTDRMEVRFLSIPPFDWGRFPCALATSALLDVVGCFVPTRSRSRPGGSWRARPPTSSLTTTITRGPARTSTRRS